MLPAGIQAERESRHRKDSTTPPLMRAALSQTQPRHTQQNPVGWEGDCYKHPRMCPLFLALPTPHAFLSSCFGRQPRDGSQVNTQEGHGSHSVSGGNFPCVSGHGELVWIKTFLSSELGGDLGLGVWTEPRDRLLGLSPGSSKAGPQVTGTALVGTLGFRTWLLGSGKRSILLARVECKEVAQSRTSFPRAPVLTPLCSLPSPRREAQGPSSWLRPPNLASAVGWVGHDIWALTSTGTSRLPAPLTAACAPPAEASGRGPRCARS